MLFVDKDLISVQEARILMEHARGTEARLMCISQEILNRGISCMAEAAFHHVDELAQLTVEETGYGTCEEESDLLRAMLKRMVEVLESETYVGVLNGGKEDGSASIGVPMGIAAVLCPGTNPSLAVIYAAFMCVKSGNAAVFAPHKRAQKVILRTVCILAEAIGRSGCPEGMLACMETTSDLGITELIAHPATKVILNIGSDCWNEACAASGKTILHGAFGPSPVFIEKTANINRAVEDILSDRSLSGGILPGAEQYLVVERDVMNQVREEMICRGAYFMKKEEEQKLIRFLCPEGKKNDPEYMGKTALWLAERVGFIVPEHTRVLISEQPYISGNNPYAKALRCPVLAYYIEDDWLHACEKCMALLALESGGHTLVIHSENEEIIWQFALKKPVGRVLVNVPAALGAMGLETDCYPSMAFGGFTTGQGITAENITPGHLTYIRTLQRKTKSCSELAGYSLDKKGDFDTNKTIFNLLKQLSIALENNER